MKSRLVFKLVGGGALMLLLSTINYQLSTVLAQGTAFTYQGQLMTSAGPATGTYNFIFTLYDTNVPPGNIVGGPVTNSGVTITNPGFFTATIDFGSVFNGSARWLEIAVSTPSGPFITLSPRQQLTPSPYALYAGNATMLANGVALGNGIDNFLLPNVAVDSFIGGGSNNQVLSTDALIVGGSGNQILDGSPGSVVVGGAQNAIDSSGSYATIGGGSNNVATAAYATVAGGENNRASGTESTVGGGTGNTASGMEATVAGGFDSTASGTGATVGGGNNIASGTWATVGGGSGNFASGTAATVAGGEVNYATNDYSTVGGGFDNNAFGFYATVPGGRFNLASGGESFAAGFGAEATNDDSFVWSDGENIPYTSDRANQFKIQAGGGVVMDVSGSSGLNPAALRVNSTSGNGVGLWVVSTSSDANAVFSNGGTGDIIKGFNGDFGGNPVFEVVNSGTVYSQGVVLTSDRNAKEHFVAVHPTEVLSKVTSLPISQWNFKGDRPEVRHLGPMAQDFHAAFGLDGADDKRISVVDEGGVALAAIQGLNEKVEDTSQKSDARIQQLEAENADLKARLEKIEQLLSSKNGGPQ